jgi:hypothetical protein
MKTIIIFIIHSIMLLVFAAASMSHSHYAGHRSEQKYFRDVTGVLSLAEFEAIKQFVLDYGDRQTFRTFDRRNPHYAFPLIEIHLGSDAGLKNFTNDPNISNFNEMAIAARDPINPDKKQYAVLIAVRKGDITHKKMWTRHSIKENRVYAIVIKDDHVTRARISTYKKELLLEILRIKSLPPAQNCYTDDNFKRVMLYVQKQYIESGRRYQFQRHELFPGERRIQNDTVVDVLDDKVLSIYQNDNEIAKIIRGRGIIVGESEFLYYYRFPYLFPRFEERAKRIFCDLLTEVKENERDKAANADKGNQ